MGSISNSLNSVTSPASTTSGSSSNSSSSSNSTGIFTGTSAYSQDFQNLITRAVAIASMPIQMLGIQQTALTNQSNELATLDTLYTKLQTTVQGIDTAMSGSSFQTDYSTANVVSATLGDGATEGVYSINVINRGAYAATVSANTWNAAPAAGGGGSAYTLVAGALDLNFTPADNSAQTVASTINSQYGNLVHATAVNVGSAAVPDWRVSLQSTTLGPMNLDLVQTPPGTPPPGLQGTSAPNNYSTSLTNATWNPAGGSFSLVVGVGGTPQAITTTDNSAQGVAAAINAQFGTVVQATVVNKGTSGTPDYRISLQSVTPGSSPLDIQNSSAASLQQQGAAASYSTSQSAATWDATADASGHRSMYTLVVGSNTYNFTPADNSADAVASTINSQYGSLVQATVVNVSSTDTPDYRISLRSTTAGTSMNLDLRKTTAVSYQNMQTTGAFAQTPGVLAQYAVDGGGAVQSNTRTITVSNGVTLTLQATGQTDVTVTRSTSALNTALSAFADAYNATVDELDKQRGTLGGPLQGQSIVSILSKSLSSIATYGSTSGQISSLETLGLSLGKDGHFTYTPLVLMGTDLTHSAGVTAFLGSAAGGGFLQSATNTLKNLEDSTVGLLKNAETDLTAQITKIGSRITLQQNRVYQLQAQLINQMAAADALIASMEQKYSFLNSMFQAQQTASQMYK
jgi:flagellar hook-associated protein 2